jgi:hypothetical protein
MHAGEPLSQEELVRRDLRRRERKVVRQLEKQRRRLEHRGIVKDLATLRREWEERRKGSGDAPAGHHVSAEPGASVSELSFNGDDDDDDDDDDEVSILLIPRSGRKRFRTNTYLSKNCGTAFGVLV